MNNYNLFALETPSRKLQKLIFYDIFGACMHMNVRLVLLFFSWALPIIAYPFISSLH